MKRFAVLYAALVGVPILALLGILRIGAGIVPPPSVGGTWRIAAEHGAAATDIPGGAGAVAFAIVQSGSRIDVTVAAEAQSAAGRVEGRRVWAEHRRDGIVRWRLDASLTNAETLAGEWQVAGEAGMKGIPFEARRDTSGAASPRGH